MLEVNFHNIEIVTEASGEIRRFRNKGKIIPVDSHACAIFMAHDFEDPYFSQALPRCLIQSIEYSLSVHVVGADSPRLYVARLLHHFKKPFHAQGNGPILTRRVELFTFRSVADIFSGWRGPTGTAGFLVPQFDL